MIIRKYNKMLIGVLGLKRSGKDTTSDYLVEKYNFKKLTFAEPLKNACKILFNFNEEQLYGSKKEEVDPRWGVSPRIIYQYLGTDIFRNHIQTIMPTIGNNFWVNLTIDNYKNLKNSNVVISDVRFENELNAIKQEGGIIIKIIRPSNENNDYHSSESSIQDLKGDYEIINDGSLEDLYKKIDIVFENTN